MMSDAENVETCDTPASPPESPEKLDQKEHFSGSPAHEDPTLSEDGKPFVGMEGELDFEVLSPEKTEKNEEQTFSLLNEVDPQTAKFGESETAGEAGSGTAEKGNESKNQGMEDGEDDGECSDDEDLEEGEVKDENETVTKARQVCRFFNRGMCFYGIQCRFLHLNNDMKGNYNMFSPTPPRTYEPPHIANMMVPPSQHLHRSAPRSAPEFLSVPPLLPAPVQQQESAWEKGLREAKELLKKANQRKEEPDFEEKRLTLSLSSADRNTQINDKENDKFGYKKKNRGEDLYKYGDPAYNRTHFGSRYENFEIRYTNVERGARSRRRTHGDRRINQREDNPGHWRNGDRMEDMEKIRAEAYFDPWRRSKSPKHRRSKDRERSRSFGGSPFSSVSSYSSRSSSFSRSSSSMSRGLSSRSPSPMSDKKKKNPANKSLYPLSPKETPNKLNAGKGERKKKPGARNSSSRSRSMSRGRSVYSSRSRSSRSLSMDSVSSASSSISHSSSGESSGRPEHVSVLRRQEEKPAEREKQEVLPPAGGSFYFQIPRPIKAEKIQEADTIGLPDIERDPLEESFHNPMLQPDTSAFLPNMQHFMPAERERAKDPVKGLHPPKQQIKLTLLNKNPQSKLSILPKKELEVIKTEEAPKLGVFLPHGIKRPLSPPVTPAATKPQPAVQKKSASSRRDELLKQLKAVEDAIARKRAKF